MKRLCYLDNLKVCLTVLVIMHHAGQAYGNGGDWAYTPSKEEFAMSDGGRYMPKNIYLPQEFVKFYEDWKDDYDINL